MRQIEGLQSLCPSAGKSLSAPEMAKKLVTDLQHCRFYVYGRQENDSEILLAEMAIEEETLTYEQFAQRIDFWVSGAIVREDYPPLTYRLQGDKLIMRGRCSMIAKVCGVDLYLHSSYTGHTGDYARQHFSIKLKSLLDN
jgi:hypothetical protein